MPNLNLNLNLNIRSLHYSKTGNPKNEKRKTKNGKRKPVISSPFSLLHSLFHSLFLFLFFFAFLFCLIFAPWALGLGSGRWTRGAFELDELELEHELEQRECGKEKSGLSFVSGDYRPGQPASRSFY